jgi:pyruvate formate lyase activating enzyme
MNETGTVFDIQRFSVHDGPGIRTVVFLKGCPLKCLWCHNPESQKMEPDLFFEEALCVLCGKCVKACPHGVHEIVNGKRVIKRELCDKCGKCVAACFPGALAIKGRTVSIQDVLTEVLKDKSYYVKSGGGVTLSGGEPLAQPAFTRALLAEFRKHGLNTAIETCGCASCENFREIFNRVDMVMYDIKIYDPESHREYCGADNASILRNLSDIAKAGKPLLVRVPLIPQITDTDDNLRQIGKFLAGLKITRVELIPYHAFSKEKCQALGIDYRLDGLKTQSAEELENIKHLLLSQGVSPILNI